MTEEEKLSELINQAEREGKWLHCNYQDLWFKPSELRAANADGRFVWGVSNFRLRDPQEQIAILHGEVDRAETALQQFIKRLQDGSPCGQTIQP